MTQIVPETGVQTDLFDRKDWAKSKKLMQAVDAINTKYARKTVLTAAECPVPGEKINACLLKKRSYRLMYLKKRLKS